MALAYSRAFAICSAAYQKMHMKIFLSLTSSFFASILLAQAGETPVAAGQYQWTENPKTPEAAEWLAQSAIATQAAGKPEIAQQLREMVKSANLKFPCQDAGLYFFTQGGTPEKRSAIMLREGVDGKDEMLVDASKLETGKEASVTIADVNADGTLLAYLIRSGDSDERNVRIYDVKARHDLPETLPAAHYNTISFSPNRKGFYYTKVQPAGTLVFFHAFGEKSTPDKLIFGESYNYEPLGPKDLISTEITRDGDFLVLKVARGETAKRVDVYTQEQEEPNQRVRPVIHAMDNHFTLAYREGNFFALTDNEAPKGRVVKIIIDDPSPIHWQVIVPEGEDTLSGIAIVGEKLFLSGKHEGALRTRILTLEGKETGQITSPEIPAAGKVEYRCPRAAAAD
jgi:prolyl oligopeptidase